MQLTKDTIAKANQYRINIEELVYLYTLFVGENWDIAIFPASIVKLTRLGILDSNEKLTAAGENVVIDCLPMPAEPKIEEDQFDEIWLKYPRDDEYRHFGKTRLLRYNKAETKRAYQEVLKEYSHEDLLAALEREIRYRQDSKRENLFKYMKSSLNWFKHRAFMDFMEEEAINQQEEYGKEVV